MIVSNPFFFKFMNRISSWAQQSGFSILIVWRQRLEWDANGCVCCFFSQNLRIVNCNKLSPCKAQFSAGRPVKWLEGGRVVPDRPDQIRAEQTPCIGNRDKRRRGPFECRSLGCHKSLKRCWPGGPAEEDYRITQFACVSDWSNRADNFPRD